MKLLEKGLLFRKIGKSKPFLLSVKSRLFIIINNSKVKERTG